MSRYTLLLDTQVTLPWNSVFELADIQNNGLMTYQLKKSYANRSVVELLERNTLERYDIVASEIIEV